MIDEALRSPNVRAFLRAIRLGEGTSDDNGYMRIVGGGNIDTFDDHPRKRVWIERYKVWSTAAGAYQFLAGTWDEMAAQYGLPDFSPQSQDIAAVGLLIRRKALDDILAGRVESAIAKCRQEWASLPGSPYGQRTESMEAVLDEYTKHGGQQVPAPITRKDTEAMSPFLIAALPALVEAIPGLIRNFGKGAVTERNAEAAERVISIVQAATGTTNAQAAVEAIKADPAARVAATEALDREGWFAVTESGGGGIEGARKFSIETKGSFWAMPAFWVSILLLAPLYVVVYAVLFQQGWPDTIKVQVVTAVLAVISIIGAFWLGSSFAQAVQRNRETDA
jgi:muramidase (phage lysozyme)